MSVFTMMSTSILLFNFFLFCFVSMASISVEMNNRVCSL